MNPVVVTTRARGPLFADVPESESIEYVPFGVCEKTPNPGVTPTVLFKYPEITAPSGPGVVAHPNAQ